MGARQALAVRSLLAFDPIVCVDPALLLRAIEVYETDRVLVVDGRREAVPVGDLAGLLCLTRRPHD